MGIDHSLTSTGVALMLGIRSGLQLAVAALRLLGAVGLTNQEERPPEDNARMKRMEFLAATVIALSFIAVTTAYLLNVTSGPFEDDFGWVRMGRMAASCSWTRAWYDAFGCVFFRPLNIALIALSLKAGSWAVAHVASLAVHALATLSVGLLAMRVFPGRGSRWLGLAAACTFYVHQGNPTAILQIDTFSQCTSDFFSIVALLAAVAYASSGIRFAVISGLAAFLAMLGKEGGVAAPLAVVATVLLMSPRAARIRKAGVALLVQVAAVIGFYLWRSNVLNLWPALEQGEGRYSFGVGLRTLRNLGQFIFVELVPWNSASLVWNRRPHEWAIAIALGASVALIAGLGWRKLIRDEPRSKVLIVWLIAVFLLWCAPYVFLARVSEQYVYRLAAVVALLISFGSWACWRSGRARLAVLALVVWCLWVSASGVASIQKSELLRRNARIVNETLEEAAAALGDVSVTKTVWVFITPSRPPRERYSVLHIPETALRSDAVAGLDLHLNKPGLVIERFMPGEEPPETSTGSPRLKKLRANIVEGTVELIP
jgi:hypothetical protein